MEPQFFSLELHEGNRLTRIFQLVFGIICIAVAIIWLIINFNSFKSNSALLITIVFLIGFGYYQINSGLGRANRFIEIDHDRIRLKKNSLLPVQELNAGNMEKIEIFPLNLIFFMRNNKTVILRFGTTFTDKIDTIKKEIMNFAKVNSIPVEINTEEF